jgi:hypothetical protein
VQVAQMSRWLNTVMVRADSNQMLLVRALPFLDSTRVLRTRRKSEAPIDKPVAFPAQPYESPATPLPTCITEAYGFAATQNRVIGIDVAHRMGIAGEGVLVGVLDAGFHWRDHEALKYQNIIAEHDFVNGDGNAADEPGEDAEEHGTAVMSMIGGLYDTVLIGGAPHVSFILAKTEDVRSEKNVEEDNFVAGLEWVEAMGADVTNTSLGYTDFDFPETGHPYSDLNGHTIMASRGLNHAVSLGMICCVAAGNEAQKSYRYIGVPAEADSSFAIAAVTSSRIIAGFSSRGFGPGSTFTTLPRSLKPDFAAMGVGNFGANHASTTALITGQGTSYASPMATAAVALILSARRSLRPWEVRELLRETSDHFSAPDTAYGYGTINLSAVFDEMSRTAPVIGYPRVRIGSHGIVVAAGVHYLGGFPHSSVTDGDPTAYVDLRVRRLGSQQTETFSVPQPLDGVARWYLPGSIAGDAVRPGDSLEMTFSFRRDGSVIRLDTVGAFDSYVADAHSAYRGVSTLCETLSEPQLNAGNAVPNPFGLFTQIEFETDLKEKVSVIVYNALGQEVARVIDDQELDPGFHTAFFEPQGLPSGSYYYAIRQGDVVRTGAMVYIHP